MLFNRTRRLALSLGAFALLLPLAGGCGSGKGNVSGNVTLDGQALPAGTITFYPAKKSQGNPVGGPITDGKYSVAGVPPGKLKVTVETSSLKQQADTLGAPRSNMANMMRGRAGKDLPPDAKKALEAEKKGADEAKQKAKELMDKYRAIPPKYESKDTTPLSADINKGTNTYNVELSSK